MSLQHGKRTPHPGWQQYAVRGEYGAVSLDLFPASQGRPLGIEGGPDGLMAGPVEIHDPVAAQDVRTKGRCELVETGWCRVDQGWRGGAEIYDSYLAGGRDEEIIYDGLERWYLERLSYGVRD